MIYPELPRFALSIRQPWAWLIVHGLKDIENRDTLKGYRGRVAIHAGQSIDYGCVRALLDGHHPVQGTELDLRSLLPDEGFGLGGIVGVADFVDCVTESDNEWFQGIYGFVIRDPRPVEFIKVKGALGFFDWRKQWEKENG